MQFRLWFGGAAAVALIPASSPFALRLVLLDCLQNCMTKLVIHPPLYPFSRSSDAGQRSNVTFEAAGNLGAMQTVVKAANCFRGRKFTHACLAFQAVQLTGSQNDKPDGQTSPNDTKGRIFLKSQQTARNQKGIKGGTP